MEETESFFYLRIYAFNNKPQNTFYMISFNKFDLVIVRDAQRNTACVRKVTAHVQRSAHGF